MLMMTDDNVWLVVDCSVASLKTELVLSKTEWL